jgi:dGTPase
MDWADDITYSVHDLEDFYRAGLIPLHLLADRRYDKERRAFFEAAFERHSDRKGIWADHKALEEAFNEVIVGLFPLERAYAGSWVERGSLRDFTSQLIGRYVGATSLNIESGSIRLKIDSDRQLEVAMLKELTWVYVIEAPGLVSQQAGEQEVVRRMFELYVKAAESDKGLHLFPTFYREGLKAAKDDPEKKRIVIDLIAGMTEAQAFAMHNRLTGVSVGSGLEQILP